MSSYPTRGAGRRRRLAAVLTATSLATAGLAAAALPAQAAGAPGKAGPASSAGSSGASAASGLLSAAQAAAKAKSSGKPVVASALTTPYEQVTANPRGGYTMTESAAPARTWKNGAWAALDPKLLRNTDGTYSPTSSLTALKLSGGGTAPLATLDESGEVMSLTLPLALPAPAVSGAQAVYANVIPGVDLTVTVATTGAFSDTFTVHSAAAAADPRLARLLSATTTLSRGLTKSVDANGDLTISSGKNTVFNVPTPYAWDSNTAAASSSASSTANSATGSAAGSASGAASSAPAASSVSGPGRAAHFVRLGVTASAKSTTLSAPTSLFHEAKPSFPMYIDPWYTPSYGANGWASFGSSSDNSGTNRWDSTPDTEGDAFVGNTGVSSIGVVWSAFNFQLPDTGGSTSTNLVGATINSVTFGIVSSSSGSCSGFDEQVNLYAPNPSGGNYLQKGNATYSHWSGASIGGSVANSTFVGQNSGSTSCGGNGAGAFNSSSLKTAVQNEVSSYHTGNQTFILRADDESDVPATKRFPVTLSNGGNPTLTIQFDKAPSAPTGLTLSTGHGCGSTLGDASTELESKASSPMGGQLVTTFDLYKSSDGNQTNLLTTANGINSDQFTATSGQFSVMALSEQFLKTVSGGALTKFTWKAQDTDGTLPTTAWSGTCTFSFDPTRPGAPSWAFAANASSYTCVPAEDTTSTTVQPVGSTCAITFTPALNTSISGFVYQVNQQSPVKVPTTTADTVTFTVPQLVNTLTVDALSSGGNIGQEATVHFDGTKLNPAAVDGSVANDGEPDVIVSGGSGAAFPAGLWLTQTHADGTTGETPVNVGKGGLGLSDTGNPAADWTGSQVITGDWCGLGAQDVMAYFPTGNDAGGANIDCSDGSTDSVTAASPLDAGVSLDVSSATLVDSAGADATGIANAYNTSGKNSGIPDLFVAGAAGLALYHSTTPNGYANDFGVCGQDCDFLTTQPSPDGQYDWNTWTITSAQTASGQTDMYLWQPTSGELVLWTNVTLNSSGSAFPNATSLAFTSTVVTTDAFNPGANDISIRAGVPAGQNTPILWATDLANGFVSSVTGTDTAGGATNVGTETHAFELQDMPSTAVDGAAVTSSADTVGSLSLTGSANGAVWHTGDAFSPDVMLNTDADNQTAETSLDGVLTGSGSAVALSGDFSVAISVRPNALGGVMLSQSGTNTAGFTLGATSAGQWQFCLAQTDAASPTEDCATGGTEQQDVWSNVVATYEADSGYLALYVDGTQVANGQHAAVKSGTFAGAFLIGAGRTSSSALGGYYSGQVAAAATWAAVAPPPTTVGAGSAFVPLTPFRLIDTRSTSKVGPITGPIAGVTTFSVKPGGTGGIPTAGVTAVSITVTTTGAAAGGFLTVYPDGTPRPVTSTVQYDATQNVTNGVVANLGTDGEFDVYNSAVNVQVIIDVTGYFTTATGTGNAGTYYPVGPLRPVDTRNGTGVATGKIAAGSKDVWTVGAANYIIPPSGVTAVAVNVTVTDATSGANIEVYQDGVSTPTLTSVTTPANGTSSAMSIVPVGSDGKIDIYNAGAAGTSADVVLDVSGYFGAGTGGQFYHPIDATRMVDTRKSGGPLPANNSNDPVQFTETVASAFQPTIVANVTETAAGANGLLGVYPSFLLVPGGISTIDYSSTSTISNMDLIYCADATSPSAGNIGNGFEVVNTAGTPQFIVDVSGFFAGY